MLSFTDILTVTWRSRGAGVKDKIQGAGPFLRWIFADDLRRLAWWCDFFYIFFPWANFWKSFANIQPKKNSPLDFIFDTCASTCLGLSKSLCHCWWRWTCLCSLFLGDKYIFSKRHMFCNLCARWHIFWGGYLFLMPDFCKFSNYKYYKHHTPISTDLNPSSQPFGVICRTILSNNHGTLFSWDLTYMYVPVNLPPWKLFSRGRTYVQHRKIILKYF